MCLALPVKLAVTKIKICPLLALVFRTYSIPVFLFIYFKFIHAEYNSNCIARYCTKVSGI